jgi:hypothetical protein
VITDFAYEMVDNLGRTWYDVFEVGKGPIKERDGTMNTATPKQMDFIKKLVGERAGLDATDALRAAANKAYREGQFSKALASATIDCLLKIERPRVEAQVLEDGFYELDGESIVKVQHAVHGSGNQYAKRLNTQTGRFEYEPGLIAKVRSYGVKLTLERAKELGHVYGRCMICGATLTNEDSIERGIGPVCASRL